MDFMTELTAIAKTHGGMNLLGKEDAWDNLIRVRDAQAAEKSVAKRSECYK